MSTAASRRAEAKKAGAVVVSVEDQAAARRAIANPSLVRDGHLAVALSTLEPGTRFKLPDSPAENLAGRHGVLLFVNLSRARVRFEGGSRTFTAKKPGVEQEEVQVTVASSGETDIGASTQVVVLEGKGDITRAEPGSPRRGKSVAGVIKDGLRAGKDDAAIAAELLAEFPGSPAALKPAPHINFYKNRLAKGDK